jgi:hypothetical protein
VSSWRILNKFLAASNYSAAVDIRLGSSITTANGYTQSQCRVELSVGTACFLSLITKNSASTVLSSAMLLPKTGSAALTINTLYTFHHTMNNARLYNYQLSAAITNVNLIVDEITEGQFYT